MRVELSVDPGADPITGTIRGGDGVAHPFCGWIGLIAGLERAGIADREPATAAPGGPATRAQLGSHPRTEVEPEVTMIVAVFRRILKQGKTFEDFKRAWEADEGFGVPTRVLTAVSLADPREVLTVGFVDVEPDELAAEGAGVADQEAVRHGRIDEVIESTEMRAMYALESEHDFSAAPREIRIGTGESLLRDLRA